MNKLTELIVEDSWLRYKQIKSFANEVIKDEDLHLDTRWKWLLEFGEHEIYHVCLEIPHIDSDFFHDYSRHRIIEVDALLDDIDEKESNDIKEYFCSIGIKSFSIDW